MQSLIILALVAVAAADVSHLHLNPEATAEVVAQSADVFPDQFNYGYRTSNGIEAQAKGQLVNVGQENAALVSEGSYAYTAPDGQQVALTYVANENGYQPQGAHLPTPPAPEPIPEYIARSLEYIRTHPPKEEKPYRA